MTPVAGDVTNLDFPDRSFDCVFCAEVLEHIPVNLLEVACRELTRVTNEYLVKWYLLIDAITRHRTDGALVRVIVPIPLGTSETDADHEVQSFIAQVAPQLEHYIPG